MSKTKSQAPAEEAPAAEMAPVSYASTAYHEIEIEDGVLRVEPGMFVITAEDGDVSVLVEADMGERFPGIAAAELPAWPPVAAPDVEE